MEIIVIELSFLIVLVSGVFIGLILIKKRFTNDEACPFCENTKNLERVKKPSLYKIIPYLSVKKMKCLKCHHTHYKIINVL